MDINTEVEEILKRYTSDSLSFPWQFFGGIPKAGPTHSYLCRIMHPYVNPIFIEFMKSSPSLRELKRLTNHMPNPIPRDMLMTKVVDYCSGLYDKNTLERSNVEVEVFKFISTQQEIKDFLREKIRNDLRY